MIACTAVAKVYWCLEICACVCFLGMVRARGRYGSLTHKSCGHAMAVTQARDSQEARNNKVFRPACEASKTRRDLEQDQKLRTKEKRGNNFFSQKKEKKGFYIEKTSFLYTKIDAGWREETRTNKTDWDRLTEWRKKDAHEFETELAHL